MTLTNLLHSRYAEALGWTLLHSVWQVALLAVATALLLAFLRRAGANVRYLLASAALVLMLAITVSTFFYLLPPGAPTFVAVPLALAPDADPPSHVAADVVVIQERPVAASALPAIPWQIRLSQFVQPYLSAAVVAYLLGILLLSTRLAAGYSRLRRLTVRKPPPSPTRWWQRLSRSPKEWASTAPLSCCNPRPLRSPRCWERFDR